MKRALHVTLFVLLFSAAGCATIDYDYPRQEAYFLPDTSDTYFGKLIEPAVAQQTPDHSGFYPMNDGVDALTARLLLTEKAEKSIDVQYYLIKNDISRAIFIYSGCCRPPIVASGFACWSTTCLRPVMTSGWQRWILIRISKFAYSTRSTAARPEEPGAP